MPDLTALPVPADLDAQYPAIPSRTKTMLELNGGFGSILEEQDEIKQAQKVLAVIQSIITTIKDLEPIIDTLKESVELLTGARANGVLRAVTPAQVESVIGIDDFDNAVNDPDWSLTHDIADDAEQIRIELENAISQARAELADILASGVGAISDEIQVLNVTLEEQQSQLNDNEASLTVHGITRATTDSALAAQIETISVTINDDNTGLAAAITNEGIARITKDNALATEVDAIIAVAGSAGRVIVQPPPAPIWAVPPNPDVTPPLAGVPLVEGDMWIDTLNKNATMIWDGDQWVNRNHTDIAANTASITSERTVRADADQALTHSVDLAQSTAGDAESHISQEGVTRAAKDVSLSNLVIEAGASLGSGVAQGLITFTAQASESQGVSAEVAIQTRRTTALAFSDTGLYVQSLPDGSGRVRIDADQFVVDTGGLTPFIIDGNEITWGGTINGETIKAKTIETGVFKPEIIQTPDLNKDCVTAVDLKELVGNVTNTNTAYATFLTSVLTIKAVKSSVIFIEVPSEFLVAGEGGFSQTIHLRFIYRTNNGGVQLIPFGDWLETRATWPGFSSFLRMPNTQMFKITMPSPVSADPDTTITLTLEAQHKSTPGSSNGSASHRIIDGSRFMAVAYKR
jgi:hypothetical protein